MRSIIALLMINAGSTAAFAAEEVAHQVAQGGATIPGRLIFWQIFNLVILFGALIYFVRLPIRDFFQQRRGTYVKAAEKSLEARHHAEKEFLEIKSRIEYLEISQQENLERAKAEAADLRHQLVREAEELAARIRTEAQRTAQVEIQKARNELHEQFVQEAISAARSSLSKEIAIQDHSRLQNEFVRHIEAVAP